MSQDAINFDQVIAPLGAGRFLSDHWCRSFLHQPGARGRFTPLLSWDALNDILKWHSPPQPQLRLFQDGAPLDMRRYIDGPVGHLKLNSGNLIALLGQGASMILEAINEASPSIAHLTAAMEEALECRVTADLHAGWRSQRATSLSCEPREIFLLQLSGRKRWQLFAPTREAPLGDDVEPSPSPAGPPLWEGILNDGDLLYLPRGFWHGAVPLDEPSLHLCLTAQPSDGAAFIAWWIGELRRHPEFRQAIANPDSAARKTYMDRLLQFIQRSAEGDPLGDFLRERAAARHVSPRLRLPEAPMDQAAAPENLSIRLATQHSLFIEQPAGAPMARFTAAGQSWFIRPEFVPLFQRLSGQESVPFRELAALVADPQLLAMLASTLDSLATAGVIFKERGHS